MPREEILLDFSSSEIYECGATLLAVLAYPAVSTRAHRLALQMSLCAYHLGQLHAGETDASIVLPLKPAYVFRDARYVQKDIKTLNRRLRDRGVAARMFRGFWQEAAGAKVKLPTGMTKLSLNQLAELVAEDAQQAGSENIETRMWRPSIPVIHVAAAMENILLDAERLGEPGISWGDILTSQHLIEEIAAKAHVIECLIGNSSKIKSQLNITPAKLVQLRLAN